MNEYSKPKMSTLADHIATAFLEAYDEINGAKKYMMEAHELQHKNKKMADKRASMASDELGHAHEIMEEAETVLREAEMQGDKTVETVRTMWHAMKNQLHGYSAWVKQLHSNYKMM